MISRAFFVPGTVLLSLAFILSLIVSISLPSLTALDFARSHFDGNLAPPGSKNAEIMREIRFGIWGYCVYGTKGDRTCIDPGHGYAVELVSLSSIVTIGPGATRGLAVHPVGTSPFTLDTRLPALTLLRTVAAVVTFIAFLFSFSSHVMLALLATFLSFLAAFLTLIAFGIDISLFVILRNRVHSLGNNVEGHTFVGPGTWITLVTLILLLVAGATGWIGRRRSRMAGATDLPSNKPGIFSLSRFRRF
jgi:hypothetical protein